MAHHIPPTYPPQEGLFFNQGLPQNSSTIIKTT